ncbi:MAG TPA: hypothetical protein DCZ94_02325 [Lentisphaeria bacterium]|nr:MAG: hypothetical protein A2X48_16225 [Lentisphaerae bacterium GWF2_49_21]HBC85770.1 hypothetical protein [Lentisphaeria bacterium]
MRPEEKKYLIAAALLLVAIFLFLHFWRFPGVPNGFFYDEASEGYNAYCIANTGADEYGTRHPMFFVCFDNYQDPVMVYTLAPLVNVFGLEKWVVRLPGALFLLIASVAFYWLAGKYMRNRWICLGGAFMFSLLPWVFPLSRTGIGGYMPMLLGLICGWYFLADAFGRNSRRSALLAGACWAFAMYSHQIGRPMSAVILVCFVLAFNVLLIKRWRLFALFSASIAVCLAPMTLSVINNPVSMTTRFSTIGVWNSSSGAFETVSRILSRYVDYFSPDFLFILGDSDLRHHTGASGELYIFMLPFIIAGLYFVIKNFRRNPYCRFLIICVLAYPAAAILTMERMHSTRCLNGSPFWCMLALVGFCLLWNSFRKYRLLVIAVCCFGLVEMAAYFGNYFGAYAVKSRSSFVAPFAETVELAFEELGMGEKLYVSSSVFHHPVDRDFKPIWYIYFLFYGKIDPATYQRNGISESMVIPFEGKTTGAGIFIRMNSRISVDSSGNPIAILNNEPVPVNSKLIHNIPLSAGSDRFFEIYRVY